MGTTVRTFLAASAAILFTGLALNEAGAGTFGEMPQRFAKAVTNGYGV